MEAGLSGVMDWVNSRLRKAVVNDMSRDFCDGTVLIELVVLLLPHNKTAVLEALEKFNDTPTTMAHSLSNIKSVLTCLTADGTHIDVETLDIFRGERDSIQRVLETLRNKYDNSDPDASSTSSGQDTNNMCTNTEKDKIKVDTATRTHVDHAAAPIITEDQGIIIKIKDSDPLCVDKERLTKDSRVFKLFIDELHYYELEMDDFEADTVGLFLTLLEDRKVDDIQDRQFRELHKMSVVFEVIWLREECCNWISNKMNKDMEDDEKLFVFEECLYILRKLELSDMMDILIVKIAAIDNSSFITKYFRELDKLDTVQLQLMLKLGGSNSELFLKTVLQNLIGKNELGENIKFLLQRMNLALCFEANNELYTAVLDTISNLTDIPVADVRFVLQLTTETIRLVGLRNEKRSNTRGSRVLIDYKKYEALRENCKTLKDITDAVSKDQVTSMSAVVDLLLVVLYNSPPNSEEMETFITTLADMCCTKRVQKIPNQYLDMITSALEHSPLQQKEQLIQLLDMIKKNERLSTNSQNVIVPIDKSIVVSHTDIRYYFTFKHPCNTNCDRSGSKCGFVVKWCKQGDNWIYELCVDEKDYENTGLHYHDSISAQDMFICYMFESNSAGDDKVISVPVLWWYWYEEWLPTTMSFSFIQFYVVLDIRDYLIAK